MENYKLQLKHIQAFSWYWIPGNTAPQGLIKWCRREINPRTTVLRAPQGCDCEGYSPTRASVRTDRRKQRDLYALMFMLPSTIHQISYLLPTWAFSGHWRKTINVEVYLSAVKHLSSRSWRAVVATSPKRRVFSVVEGYTRVFPAVSGTPLQLDLTLLRPLHQMV